MNILITEKEFHEYRTLQKQLSQLQQDNHRLLEQKVEKMDIIRNQSFEIKNLQQEKEEIKSDLYVANSIIKDLLESNEELINHCHHKLGFLENCVGGEVLEITGEMKAYTDILSKLKESDKNEKDSSI
jgi:serine phosphatase RsbU (regulator of sigma subunit)